MNATMENIVKQSKVVMILCEVARIILYVMLGLALVALVGSFFNYPDPLFIVFGVPVRMIELTKGMTVEAARVDLVESIVQICLALALLFITSDLFRLIHTSENPFGKDVVKKMKTVAVLLGVTIAIDNGYLGVVIGFVIYAFAMIFDYGRELQKQVDETL